MTYEELLNILLAQGYGAVPNATNMVPPSSGYTLPAGVRQGDVNQASEAMGLGFEPPVLPGNTPTPDFGPTPSTVARASGGAGAIGGPVGSLGSGASALEQPANASDKKGFGYKQAGKAVTDATSEAARAIAKQTQETNAQALRMISGRRHDPRLQELLAPMQPLMGGDDAALRQLLTLYLAPR